MNLLQKKYNYYSERSVEDLRNDIQELFDNKYPVNLTGEFTSKFDFRITPKWQLIFIKNFERKQAYLNGRIFQDELKRTRVTFTVRPNSIFVMFFFIFPLFGIAFLNSDHSTVARGDLIGMEVAFILVVPVVMFAIGYFAKKSIKKKFIYTFDLKEA